jgi:ribosome-binding protein aMBF1 (putative translation factor)
MSVDRTQVGKFGRHPRIASIHSAAPEPADCDQSALCDHLAGEVGYALCKIAEEPRRISTSRSATLPELGRNLRRVRTAAGLTQTALAKRSGTDRSYVSGLEAGQRNPTALTLQRLAKVLGVTHIAFFQ